MVEQGAMAPEGLAGRRGKQSLSEEQDERVFSVDPMCTKNGTCLERRLAEVFCLYHLRGLPARVRKPHQKV